MKKTITLIIIALQSLIIYAQLPYNESFETDLGIWTQSISDQFDWTRNSGPTPTSNTGPAVASNGDWYLYIEATGHNNPPETAIIEANFDFSGTTLPILSFDYHMWGEGMGYLRVYVYDGSSWTEVWNHLENSGNYWFNAKICLGDYADNANVKIRFMAQTNYSELSDIAIDNIKIRDFSILSINQTPVTCGQYSDGTIEITLTGGFSPYEYSINDGIDYTSNASTTYTFSGLPGGDYPVKVRDVSGCVLSGGNINVYEPETPDITTNKLNVSPCSYSTNGQIEIFASGDNSPFTYSINGFSGPFQVSNTFTNLDTGNYQIAVRNTLGCIALANVVSIIAPADILIIDVETQDVSTCFGDCNGEIEIYAGGGHSPLSYSIDEGVNFDYSTYFPDLCEGTYRIIIQDNSGCLDTTEYYTISQPDLLSFVDVDSGDVTGCFGDENGYIIAQATGGTGTIQYSIDNGYMYYNDGDFSNISAGNYHLVIRDQNNCSADWGIITIGQPDLLLIDSVVTIDIQGCYGDADGQITIYDSGGTGAKLYSIDNGVTLQASNVFTNLDVGDYFPYVVDENGCERTYSSVEISQPQPLIISNVATFDVSDCYGSNTGMIQIFASLGNAPYQYSIDGGTTYQSSYLFSDLVAGEYYIAVIDDHSCEIIGDTVIIGQPEQIVVTDTVATDVSCFGGNDGTIFVDAQGGTGTLMYSINNGLTFPFNAGNLTYQSAGTYQIIVKDDNDCEVSGGTLTINQADSLSIDSIGVVDVELCYGDSTGILTLYVSGGNAPLNYSIDNGFTTQTSNIFTNLPARTGYLPFVIDNNGCFAMHDPITITQPPLMLVTGQSHTNIDTCHGVPVGTITITTFGGTGIKSYSIDNGTNYYENGGFFDNLYAGSYLIKVKDQNNCIANGWEEPIYEPDTLLIDSIVFHDVVCHNQGNGSIYIYASGGQPQLYYSVNDGYTFSPSYQFSNLQPGDYDILVKDQYNCQVSDFVSIIEPPQFFIDTVIYENVQTCYGDNTASITIQASGGIPDFLYSYTNITTAYTSPFQDTNVFENLSAGAYYITVKDANGCTLTSTSFNISQPSQVLIQDYESTNITCTGLNDGTITIFGSGGVGGYEYSIDNENTWFDNGGVFTNLYPDDYIISVRDSNNCTCQYNITVTIYEPSQLQIESVTPYNPECYGYSNGHISVYAIGGTGQYTYILNDLVIQQENVFDSLPEGQYWITVYDANNCVAQSDTVELIMPENYSQYTPSVTQGCSPLEVSFNQTFQQYAYKWIFGDGDTLTFANPTHVYENHTEQNVVYDLEVIVFHGNCRDTSHREITVYSQPNLYFSVDTSIHYYPDTTVFITNHTTNYDNYFWDFGDGQTISSVSPISHSYHTCGNYVMSMIAESQWSCADTFALDIMITAVDPQASFLIDNLNGCAPLDVNFTNLSANAQEYEWFIDDVLVSNEQNLNYIFEQAGYFYIELNAKGYCEKENSIHKTVDVFPAPIVDFDVEPDTVAVGQEIAYLNYTTGADYYNWNFGDGEYSADEYPRRSYSQPGTYSVTLLAISQNGCRDSLTFENAVFVSDDMYVVLPPFITPNNDGANDLFIPIYNLVSDCRIEVYNRRWQLVFKTDDFKTIFWDGTKNGKPLPIDVYVWRASGRYSSGQYFEKIGEVTLLR